LHVAANGFLRAPGSVRTDVLVRRCTPSWVVFRSMLVGIQHDAAVAPLQWRKR
jgi:hypothetical protein